MFDERRIRAPHAGNAEALLQRFRQPTLRRRKLPRRQTVPVLAAPSAGLKLG
jgi:hypothetical protein